MKKFWLYHTKSVALFLGFTIGIFSSWAMMPASECLANQHDPSIHEGWPRQLHASTRYGTPWRNRDEQMLLADLDQDGTLEVVVGDGAHVFVFQHTGDDFPGWPKNIRYSFTSYLHNGPVVGDLTGDGFLEIVAAERHGQIFIWRYNGTLLPGWPKPFPSSFAIDTSSHALSIEDIDGDGRNDVIATSHQGTIYVFDVHGKPALGWPATIDPDVPLSTPTVGDIDFDGDQEIICLSLGDPVKLYVLDHAGQIVKGWPKVISPAADLDHGRPVLGDLDHNGDLEIVVGSTDGSLYAFHHTGTMVHGWPQRIEGRVNTAAIVDVDHDGRNDVIVGTTGEIQSGLYVFQNSGNLFSGWPIIVPRREVASFSSSFGFGPPAIADIDGDALPDIIIGQEDTLQPGYGLYAYKWDGTLIPSFPKETGNLAGPLHSPAVADVDGDGFLEIALISYVGQIFLLDTQSPKEAPQPWPMFHQNPQHTGGDRESLRLSVHLSSSKWDQDFLDRLSEEGYGQVGISLSSDPRSTVLLPWPDIDHIEVRSSQPVPMGSQSLILEGDRRAEYPLKNFHHDPSTNTTRWTIDTAIMSDRLRIKVLNSVSHTYVFFANILVGDMNQDMSVDIHDGLMVRASLFQKQEDPRYRVECDMNGNGYVNILDALVLRRMLFQTLEKSPSTPFLQVHARSTLWNSTFLDRLMADGFGQRGVRIPASTQQPLTLPWKDVNLIEIRSSQDTPISPDSLVINGAEGMSASLVDFHYDPVTGTAYWKLSDDLQKKHLAFSFHDTYFSDDVYQFTILLGDLDGNGVIEDTEKQTFLPLFRRIFDPDYSIRHDIDADGMIGISDALIFLRELRGF